MKLRFLLSLLLPLVAISAPIRDDRAAHHFTFPQEDAIVPIDYIESTGTQYIDTGVYPSDNIGTSMDVLFVSTYGISQYYVFEARRAYHDADFGIINFVDINNQLQFRYGNTDSKTRKLQLDTIHRIETSKGILSVGGTPRITVPENAFSTPITLKLFALDKNGSITPTPGVRIYAFKIYDNSTLVRDYTPVRKGTIGYLYDRVSGQLFGNQGTGDFLLGPDL